MTLQVSKRRLVGLRARQLGRAFSEPPTRWFSGRISGLASPSVNRTVCANQRHQHWTNREFPCLGGDRKFLWGQAARSRGDFGLKLVARSWKGIRNRLRSSPFSSAARTSISMWAPWRDQRICCFFTIRLATSEFTADSARVLATRRPARWRFP
jgi:hypothetical protein